MAADDDNNEVDGNGATGNDDAMLDIIIVKLIILLICLPHSFYRQKALPPGEQTSQCRRTFEGERRIPLRRAVW